MTEPSILQTILPHVGELAVAVVTALVAWASASVKRLIDAKVSNTRAAGVMTRLNDAVWAAVLETQQTLRPILQAKAQDGKLSLEDGAELAKIACARARQLLGPVGWTELVRLVGGEEEATVAIRAHIEGQVLEAKRDLGK
jgi:hypothetical protein